MAKRRDFLKMLGLGGVVAGTSVAAPAQSSPPETNSPSSARFGANWHSLVYSPVAGRWLCFDRDGRIISSSDDAITWSKHK